MRWENLTIVLFASFLALAPLVSAASLSEYSAEYDISGGRALVSVYLKAEPAAEFLWRIPLDAESINSESSYELEQHSDYNLLIFQNITELSLSYVTSSVLESPGDSFFILDLSQVDSPKKSILVKLPEGAVLKHAIDSAQPSIIPKTSDVATDGKRIIIHWDEADITRSGAVMVIYSGTEKRMAFAAVLIAALAVMIIAGAHYYLRRARQRAEPASTKGKRAGKRQDERAELTRNLFEEEKLIVQTLLKEPMRELWQKQLEIKTGLTKVKLSRKIRSLEQKGAIEKIPYGNTNKIRVKS